MVGARKAAAQHATSTTSADGDGRQSQPRRRHERPPPHVQAKLRVGAADDRMEREADATAEQITPKTLHAQELAEGEGEDAKGQIASGRFRKLLEFPRYVQELGAAAAADMFLGNADRIGGVVNLGNWMAAADERVRLIDNMDDNAASSFDKSQLNSELFPPDMRAWAKDPEQYTTELVDRLLDEADQKGDPGIIAWAQQSMRRKFIIDDFSRGFEETKAKIIRLYATDKKKWAGRRTKLAIKGASDAGHADYWEVLKARARFLKNPKRAKSLTTTVMKRQKSADKKGM